MFFTLPFFYTLVLKPVVYVRHSKAGLTPGDSGL